MSEVFGNGGGVVAQWLSVPDSDCPAGNAQQLPRQKLESTNMNSYNLPGELFISAGVISPDSKQKALHLSTPSLPASPVGNGGNGEWDRLDGEWRMELEQCNEAQGRPAPSSSRCDLWRPLDVTAARMFRSRTHGTSAGLFASVSRFNVSWHWRALGY